MDITDFIIGLCLVNTLPHTVLGIWKGRIFSGLGFGNLQNIGYGLINFTISLSLFWYKYGVEGLFEHGIYAGGLFIALAYFLVGKLCYKKFHEEYYQEKGT